MFLLSFPGRADVSSTPKIATALDAVIPGNEPYPQADYTMLAGVGGTARVLVPCRAEWRWMAAGAESPWYPGFRTYRQRLDSDWSGTLECLTQDPRDERGSR